MATTTTKPDNLDQDQKNGDIIEISICLIIAAATWIVPHFIWPTIMPLIETKVIFWIFRILLSAGVLWSAYGLFKMTFETYNNSKIWLICLFTLALVIWTLTWSTTASNNVDNGFPAINHSTK